MIYGENANRLNSRLFAYYDQTFDLTLFVTGRYYISTAAILKYKVALDMKTNNEYLRIFTDIITCVIFTNICIKV